jgi:hypothetical protein
MFNGSSPRTEVSIDVQNIVASGEKFYTGPELVFTISLSGVLHDY